MDSFAAGHTARRRARNLRLGSKPAARARLPFTPWLLPACGVLVLGAVLLAQAARSLGSSGAHAAAGESAALSAFQPLLGGVTVRVPRAPGIEIVQHGANALVVASSMRLGAPVRIDLCTRPVRIGYPFGEAAELAPARNLLLAATGSAMPRVDLRGDAGGAMRLAWNAGGARAAWVGDAGNGGVVRGARGQALLGTAGWLVWPGGALRLTRRASSTCARAGELLVQRAGVDRTAGGALVQAFGPGVALPALQLAAGDYRVPARAPRALEDALLFEQLQARGLIRLGPGGLAEAAPRDLATWTAASPEARAPLPGWEAVRLDEEGRKLLVRLYYRADGAFVREQLRVFNSERRLLAWRVRPHSRQLWQASVGGVPVAQDAGLPVAAMRLFARLPEGWAPWARVGAWDGGGGAATARLSLDQAEPSELLLAGRLRRVEGATASVSGVCDGRACRERDAVQRVLLAPVPGARRIVLEIEPLDLARLSGNADAAYRHVRAEGGRLAWQALPASNAAARPALAEVRLSGRNGESLWTDGRASAAAQAAGLAPLLGVHREHASSVAGMLARLPGSSHAARLSLDLRLQEAAQAVLDCVGLRAGQWDGRRCLGAGAIPEGRQAGLVLLDAGNGDVLAAAGGGVGAADPARWPEIRDFDRADPARSPLRLPAFQHDGGARRAPGSTFKVVTALGLEAAARGDARLERLLAGLPLTAIDAMAGEAGYGFRTGAPAYPQGGGARITNFREQLAGARAVEGRFGLAQALAHSVNTWFAWTTELGDRSLGGGPNGGVPGVREIDPGALDALRPVAGMARRLGFGTPLRLDGGLLPQDFRWSGWDALQASPSQLDPIQTRHEVRQMAIGLRMQATPLQMALVAAAVGQGRLVAPRLLLELDGRAALAQPGPELGVRLDRVRAGMKGVVQGGTAAGAFRGKEFDALRAGLFGKTGTAPTGEDGMATVWFMGWLEPGSLPGQTRRLAFAAFVSESSLTGGAHAAPLLAGLLRFMQGQSLEQKGN
ncbi:penicillin-binding transpeptidase domain-containing protein [Massilia alkalitolerans]|uniref:penicillin-binding transpeptidase domain-containing protein n=1 Tax=Massilia alkalitolerans TaxID=286638 RepID=UPI000419CA67|nr:penicillin-binding transpeptidase domain-containing protein [Massilia alkalitolerans]